MILKGSVFSKELMMDTGITVITPADYEDNTPYEVCTVLHGLCGRHSDMANYTMLPAYANEYHCVFVMPEVGRSFYTDMAYGLNYFSYVAKELPVICQNVFRVSGTPEESSIIGVSMGGYGALKCALTFPGSYKACCAISPGCLFLKDFLAEMKERQAEPEFVAMWGERFIGDFRAAFGEHFTWKPGIELLELAQQAAQATRVPAFYAMCGTNDSLLDLNRQFSRQIKEYIPGYTYEEWDGAHNWSFFNQAIEKALAYCLGK